MKTPLPRTAEEKKLSIPVRAHLGELRLEQTGKGGVRLTAGKLLPLDTQQPFSYISKIRHSDKSPLGLCPHVDELCIRISLEPFPNLLYLDVVHAGLSAVFSHDEFLFSHATLNITVQEPVIHTAHLNLGAADSETLICTSHKTGATLRLKNTILQTILDQCLANASEYCTTTIFGGVPSPFGCIYLTQRRRKVQQDSRARHADSGENRRLFFAQNLRRGHLGQTSEIQD